MMNRLTLPSWKALLPVFLAGATLSADPGPLELYYTAPANYVNLRTSQEALPIGNGKLAAMVYGGTGTEYLQFNEDTVWAGAPNDYSNPGAGDWLETIRNYIWEGEGEAAYDNAVRENFMSVPLRQSPYVGAGVLVMDFGHQTVTDYRRTLDLETAKAVITYTHDGVDYRRETFASYPDKVIVMRLTASEPGSLSFDLSYDSPHVERTVSIDGTDFIMEAKVNQDANSRRQQTSEIEFEARARLLAEGGTVTANGTELQVQGADTVTIVFHVGTNFVRFNDLSGDPAARALAAVEAAAGKTYAELEADHLADYQELFNRVTLDLGTTDAALAPTDERLRAFETTLQPTRNAQKASNVEGFMAALDLEDPQLIALNFQMARYLTIAASRPGSQPMNLQGKWNNELDPSWESKMTLNINQEMNYWLSEVGNLAECHVPMIDLVRDLSESGAIVADVHYNADGWMVHHNTDLWRGAAPINSPGGLWPTGNAWLSMHLWWHYEYSQDPDTLAEIYPYLRGAVEFHEDFLVMDPRSPEDEYPAWGGEGQPQWGKYLLTNPSHSPEQGNKLLDDNGEIVAGPMVDNQLLRALFGYFIEASETLGEDPELRQTAINMRELLPPNMIGRHGQLQEWLEDVDVPENPAIGGHRHLSHMIDLFPGEGIHPLYEPELTEALKVSLDWKGDQSNNTSWSRAWKMNLRAAMLAGDHAFMILTDVIARSHTDNMTFSNKGNGEDQIDGNFGVAMGTAQFFLQSRRGEIHLLPALPSVFPAGSVTGLRAKGGFEVDLEWNEGRLTEGVIHSLAGEVCRLRSATPLEVRKDGAVVELTQISEGLVEFPTEAGSAYTVLSDGAEVSFWGGEPIDADGFVEAPVWGGRVYVADTPWVWMERINNWLYAVESSVSSDGGWFLTINWAVGQISAGAEPFWDDFVVDAGGWVETGDWLGRLNVADAPWIWSESLESWLFARSFGPGAAWIYFFAQMAA